MLKLDDSLVKARRLQSNLERDIARYSNEKEATESKIDNLKNDRRKLLREVSLFKFNLCNLCKMYDFVRPFLASHK